MNFRSQAQDAGNWYFSHLDPFCPNDENIKNHLRGPVLAMTVKILQTTSHVEDSTITAVASPVEEEKKSTSGSDWRDYLPTHPGNLTPSSVHSTFDKMSDGYKSLSRRAKARMEAFLAGCALAVENDPSSASVRKKKQEGTVSLQEGLSGFVASKSVGEKSQLLSSMTGQGKKLMRQISSTRSSVKHPQINEEDLVIRLDLYTRTLQRVKTLNEDCVIAMEPPKTIRMRARSITEAFVATAGCVRSMSPVLTRLLNCLTMELLAVEVLSEDISKVIRRIVLEYEHGTSFASLAFLSTPEANADSLLTPLLLRYLRYLQSNWEQVIKDCELERMLTRALDPAMRKIFKTIEFRSIGHLLEVCHENRHKLHNIELAPNVCAMAENINTLCNSKEALRQALRDLQREVITVNGHVLPPVTSRKELLNILTQTLNSRTLTAGKRKSRRKHGRKYKRTTSAPPSIDLSEKELSPTKERKTPNTPGTNETEESDFLFSSECESSAAFDYSHDEEEGSLDEVANKESKARTFKRSFHISMIDVLTRRLLIAASRTGNGGDAYFVVRDLFGGEDVEVVPTNTVHIQGRMVRPGTIDILVRLASVTIKCHQSFDVYPKSLVGESEPLIQFHTTTTETINLQEVRSEDTDDDIGNIPDEHHGDNTNTDNQNRSMLVVQEQKTAKTGWRTISIRPALYEKIDVWDTPS